jgi:cytochrome bd-type quinol oxidase subunit 1
MAKGIQDYTPQESVAPYIKAVAATGNAQDPCRAVHMTGTSASVNLTVADTVVAFWLIKGHTYPICATKSSSTDVVLLY